MDTYGDRPSKRPRRSRSPSRSPSHSSYHSKPWRSSRHDSGTHSRPDSRSSFRRNDTGNTTSQRSAKDLIRVNQLQEDERMRQWVAQEDDFVLKQSKKKAQIRVKEGRAKSVDWLAVILNAVDEGRRKDVGFEEIEEQDLDFKDPESVFEDLDQVDLAELQRDIESYERLETGRMNREYWRMMGTMARDRISMLRRTGGGGLDGRATNAVKSDIDKLIGPKTLVELEGLEKQVRAKLDGDEPVDTDYWSQLLESLLVWKARAKLKQVWRNLTEKRLEKLRIEQKTDAERARRNLAAQVGGTAIEQVGYEKRFDPDPMLAVPSKDKNLEVIDESAFLQALTADRQKILRQGYIPAPKATSLSSSMTTFIPCTNPALNGIKSDSTTTAFDKLVARGVDEDEEVFNAEEPSSTTSTAIKPSPTSSTGLRKPLSFNRVQLGYDWNKYNQTHYDADNPPPRVVQGYKFHIFYPDLADRARAPTYKIMRENGRKKGESLAAAGEEDMCIIRFTAGPPYEDVAFRIVDRDWDYSGKEGRGFKSVFADGVLSLWFSFKKVYYRK